MKYLQAALAVVLVASAGVALIQPAMAQTAGQNDPSAHQIFQAVSAGRLAEAQQMVDQVLRDHPRSGEAHFVAAEVYAREGDFDLLQRVSGRVVHRTDLHGNAFL